MKLTVQKLMDATLVVSQIIRERRPMPQKGKYRLARMHAKLLPEFTIINTKRDEMITAYGYHPMVPGPATISAAVLSANDNQPPEMVPSDGFAVPADKMAEFTAAWTEIAAEEIDVDVEAIPLAQLDLGDSTDGAVEANELIAMGDLVTE